MSEVLDNQQPVIDNITTNINQIVESIGIVIDKSLSMKSVMQYISTVQFLNIVKVDHVIWKMEVYKLLLNKDINSKITMHDQCRLGNGTTVLKGSSLAITTVSVVWKRRIKRCIPLVTLR